MTAPKVDAENPPDGIADVAAMRQELNDAYQRYVAALPSAPIDYQGDMHANMCVRIAGALEQLIATSITHYVYHAINDALARSFALSWWRRSPNLVPKTLRDVLGRFGNPWVADLEQFLDEYPSTASMAITRREALGHLMDIRNDTAHGRAYKGSNASIATYKAVGDDLYNWVEQRLLIPITPTAPTS